MKRGTQIKVMIADDHSPVRNEITALQESQPDLKVVAGTGRGREGLELYRRCKPDVVLMDLPLPGMGGVEATLDIRKDFPDARIIVLSDAKGRLTASAGR